MASRRELKARIDALEARVADAPPARGGRAAQIADEARTFLRGCVAICDLSAIAMIAGMVGGYGWQPGVVGLFWVVVACAVAAQYRHGQGELWDWRRSLRVVGSLVASLVAAYIRWPSQTRFAGVLLAVLAVIGGTMALWDWWQRRNRPASVTDPDVALWRSLVWDKDAESGYFPGALISDEPAGFDVDPDGRVRTVTLRVHCTQSADHAEQIRSLAPRIAHTFSTRTEGITWQIQNNQRALITITHEWWLNELAVRAKVAQETRRARILRPHPWQGPRLDPETGAVTFGRTEDGEPLLVPLFVPGQGTRHTWFAGTSGSGKTDALRGYLASCASERIVIPHVIDMQGGASIAEWDGLAASFETTIPGALRLLRRLKTLAEIRAEELRALHGKPWTVLPSPDKPIHKLVVEEATLLVPSDPAMTMIKDALTGWRKLWMNVDWVTQPAIIGHAFGEAGSTAREQFAAGSVNLFAAGPETRSLAIGQNEPDLDLAAIPVDTPGACLVRNRFHRPPALGRTPEIKDAESLAAACFKPVMFEWPDRVLEEEAARDRLERPGAYTSMPSLPDLPDFDLQPASAEPAPGTKAAIIRDALRDAHPATLTTGELTRIAGCSRTYLPTVQEQYPWMRKTDRGEWAWAAS